MTEKNAEQALADALKTLPREALPERDLWPGIAHAIQTPATPVWHRQMALAASVVLVIALSIYFGGRQPLPLPPNPLVEEFLSSLQSEHQSSKQALLVQYQGQEAFYPEWEVQMRQLEQAEQAIYEALRDDPDNIELMKILRQVQTKQIDLIDAVFNPRLNSI